LRWNFSNKRFGIQVKTIDDFLPDDEFTIQSRCHKKLNFVLLNLTIKTPKLMKFVLKSLDFSESKNYKENKLAKISGNAT